MKEKKAIRSEEDVLRAPIAPQSGEKETLGQSSVPAAEAGEGALRAPNAPQTAEEETLGQSSVPAAEAGEGALRASNAPRTAEEETLGQNLAPAAEAGEGALRAEPPAEGQKKAGDRYYLMCERNWIYFTLMVVSGFFGAFTYLLRGNVFCNAQTGNVVLMGMALGAGKWSEALYYLIPISAYLLGAFVSELLPNPVKRRLHVRWDTLLIAVEMAVVVGLGFVPESAPVQISQVAINFIASMQYNTFRQAQGEPVATTFATNHIRQIGVGVAKAVMHIRSKDKSYRPKLYKHLFMLLFFVVGAVVGTLFCNLLLGRAIWFTLIPLGVVFAALLYADLTTEKGMKDKKPSGH